MQFRLEHQPTAVCPTQVGMSSCTDDDDLTLEGGKDPDMARSSEEIQGDDRILEKNVLDSFGGLCFATWRLRAECSRAQQAGGWRLLSGGSAILWTDECAHPLSPTARGAI